jgi:hypothetical protein
LGGTGGHTVLESSGAAQASDRYQIEITGGASRIIVTESGD